MKNILSVREARANFHQLLKMVKNKEDVIVENQQTGEKFRIASFEEKPSKNKSYLLKQIAKINLKSSKPDEIRRIIKTRLENETSLP